MPAERYRTDEHNATAEPTSWSRTSSGSSGAGHSSTTFWLRRWSEQSRVPRASTSPKPSPNTWTSTCRARRTSRSRKTPELAKLLAATLRTVSQAARSSSGDAQARIPIPPPPPVALSITG